MLPVRLRNELLNPAAVGRQQVYSAEQQTTCVSSCAVTKASAPCAPVCPDHASLKGSEMMQLLTSHDSSLIRAP